MLNKLLSTAFMGLLISTSGCGGSGGDSKNSTSTSSYKQIVGDWITDCENYESNKSRVRSISYPEKKDDNSQKFILVSALFETSNCSGDASIVGFGGPIDYRGAFTTSICIAEKTDINLTDGIIDDVEVSGSELQQLFLNVGLVNPSSNIACKYNDQILTGLFTSTLNGSSDLTRPTEMNASEPFNYWDRTSEKTKRKATKGTGTNLQIFYSDFESIIK